MQDLSTPFIAFGMLCGAVISIRLGLLWRDQQGSSGGLVLVAALLALSLSFLAMIVAGLLQTACSDWLSMCRGTSDTNIYNFVVWPLMAAPAYWLCMLVFRR